MQKDILSNLKQILKNLEYNGGYLYEYNLKNLTGIAEKDTQNAKFIIEECTKIIQRLKKAERTVYVDDAYYIRGLMYEIIEDYKNAISDFTRAVDMYEDADGALFERGKVYYTLQNYKQALEDLNLVIERDSNSNGDYYYYRGLTHKALGNNEQATKDLQIALKMAENK